MTQTILKDQADYIKSLTASQLEKYIRAEWDDVAHYSFTGDSFMEDCCAERAQYAMDVQQNEGLDNWKVVV